ncbi:MAG: hypothetical protein ACFE0J_11235 [Elainellaceae cyanobacterium]
MTKAPKNRNLTVVELNEDVLARTPISIENHAALRSGFAGYTANPRWNASKFRAWRIGRQWRNALNNGEMVVRESDSMLVPVDEGDQEPKLPANPRRPSISERLNLKNAFALLT